MSEENKELMHQNETGLANLYDGIDMEDDGFESVEQGDFQIPYIKVLSALSNEVKKTSDKRIEGAEPGMLANTATRELFDTVKVIPVKYGKSYREYTDEKQGDFVAAHYDSELWNMSTKVDDSAARVTPDGTYLFETAEWHVLQVLEDGSTFPALILMSKSKLKKSKAWMTQAMAAKVNGKKAPLFTRVYNIGAVLEVYDNNEYYNFNILGNEPVTDRSLLEQAVAFREQVKEGVVTEKHEESADVM